MFLSYGMARLPILDSTIKQLFCLAQNRCAFPRCKHRLYDEDMTLYGEICHIEAANEGGERFNPAMTDEDRRHFSNLLILCGVHHKTTNNIKKYTASILKKMKADHEAKAFNSPLLIDDTTLKKLVTNINNQGQISVIYGNVETLIQNQTINNNFGNNTSAEAIRNLGILSEIFEYILANNTSGDENTLLENSEKFSNTREKIKLNFPEEQQPAIRRMLLNTVHIRQLVETFLNNKSLTHRGRVLALREVIQANFCSKLGVYDSNTVVGDVRILEELVTQLLPSEKIMTPEYRTGSLAMILFFFEICDIGKKTNKESNSVKVE